MNIRSRLLGGVALGLLATPLYAADMPVKAAPRPAPVVSTWTGAYGGVFMGAGWATNHDPTVTMQRFTGGGVVPHPLQTGTLSNGNDILPFGGLEIGYNWQTGQVVLGVEADIAFSGRVKYGSSGVLAEGPITGTFSGQADYDYFGTVRGRVGYLVQPSLLAYFTGGWAYARINETFAVNATGPGPVGTFAFQQGGKSNRNGWVLGGGLEWKLDRVWSVKAEYQYLNFDDDNRSASTTIVFTPGQQGVYTTQLADTSIHTVRLGLNYKFWGL